MRKACFDGKGRRTQVCKDTHRLAKLLESVRPGRLAKKKILSKLRWSDNRLGDARNHASHSHPRLLINVDRNGLSHICNTWPDLTYRMFHGASVADGISKDSLAFGTAFIERYGRERIPESLQDAYSDARHYHNAVRQSFEILRKELQNFFQDLAEGNFEDLPPLEDLGPLDDEIDD